MRQARKQHYEAYGMLISNGKIEQVFKTHLHKVYGTKLNSSSPAGKTDQFTLSREAAEIRDVKQAVAGSPDVRPDVVRRFSDMMKSGTYAPTDEEIADTILGKADSV